MKRYIKSSLAVVILLCLIPLNALANSDGSVTGTFGITVAPELDSIAIFSAGTVQVPAALTPVQEYDFKITVTDQDSIGELDRLTFRMWYDYDGTKGNEEGFLQSLLSPVTRMEIVWERESNTATLTPLSNSSWELDSFNSILPGAEDFSSTTFTFVFRVKVSRAAMETAEGTTWHIGARAEDQSGFSSFLLYENGSGIAGMNMNWYGEIYVAENTTVDWGNIPPGTDFADDHAQQRMPINTLKYYSNGNYVQRAKSTSIWTNHSGVDAVLATDPTAANTFALKTAARMYQHGDSTTEPRPETGISLPTDGSFIDLLLAGSTDELGNNMSPHPTVYLYGSGLCDLFIKLSDTIDTTVYSGIITFGIAND